MKYRKKFKGSGALGPLLIMIAAAVFGAFSQPDMTGKLQSWLLGQNENIDVTVGSDSAPDGAMSVHYIDVGKCNCVLIRSGDGHDMMIDAGCNDDTHAQKIVDYLQAMNIEELEYLVLTHPHMDHIYAVPQILDCIEVDEVLMGDHDPEIVGTKIYQRVLAAIEEKDPVVTDPTAGEVYDLGNASFTILAHDDSEMIAQEELNDCSIALMVTDGIHRFLFYGDGEERVENAMLTSGFDLSADVLMVSHHGSYSSTGQKLVDAVQPEIAVIPSGIDQDGMMQEPSAKVLERLERTGAQVFRSDQNGTIVIYSREDGLYVECER